MQQLDHDEVSLVIDAPPGTLYALVADVTRMPELSPELVECHWLDGATEPAVGARFAARNKVKRGPSWVNKPVITTVEPSRAISWARTEPFGGTVEWTYRFDAEGNGTRVTESYRVTKRIGRVGWLIIGSMAGGDRRSQLRAGMRDTLRRINDMTAGTASRTAEPPN
jgi:Polyketide cyclase / dehydrase and lipid transport